jgi:AcrR family transcriptional regulator
MNDRSQTSGRKKAPRATPRSRFPAQRVILPSGVGPEGTRRRVLEAGLQLFARWGFHGTSMRDLAGALELQPGALYVHFPSKEHILAELSRLGHEAHNKALRTALLDAGSEPAEQLRALVRAHVTVHATHPQLAVIINEELYALPPELAAPALALRQQSTALLMEVIERGVALGHFSCRNVLVTTAAISAMGLRTPYWYKPKRGLAVRTLAELSAELALRMLGQA